MPSPNQSDIEALKGQYPQHWHSVRLLTAEEVQQTYDGFVANFTRPGTTKQLEKVYRGKHDFRCFFRHAIIPHRTMIAAVRPQGKVAAPVNLTVVFEKPPIAYGWELAGDPLPWHRVFRRGGPAFAIDSRDPNTAYFYPHAPPDEVVVLTGANKR